MSDWYGLNLNGFPKDYGDTTLSGMNGQTKRATIPCWIATQFTTGHLSHCCTNIVNKDNKNNTLTEK